MGPQRILICHNHYRWQGGEDRVVADEAELLESRGHEVRLHTVSNREILEAGRLATLSALWQSKWSYKSFEQVQKIVSAFRPDIVHIHNIWFRYSPAIIAACHKSGIPVVMTLHNFRLFCAGGVLLDNQGRACQKCLRGNSWRGVWRRCYHRSMLASWFVARMQQYGWEKGIWQTNIDRYILPSEFCRRAAALGGLPTEKLSVKAHSVAECSENPSTENPDIQPPRILFIGRLSREKGLHTLMTAWREVSRTTDAELHIVGEGPLTAELTGADKPDNVVLHGNLEGTDLSRQISRARLVVLPSECYETFGLVVIEAYAHSRPVLVSNIGGPAELVTDRKTGILFTPGDPHDLTRCLLEMLNHPEECRRMGSEGRKHYEEKYTKEKNYARLMEIYGEAIAHHQEHCREKED